MEPNKLGRRSERLSRQGMLASENGDGDVIQVVSRAFWSVPHWSDSCGSGAADGTQITYLPACMATGNTARVYGLPGADHVFLDASLGSCAKTALEAFALVDSPAVAMVMIEGE